MKYMKKILTAICAGTIAIIPMTHGIIASAAETPDNKSAISEDVAENDDKTKSNIGDDGYKNYATGTYLCCSEIGVTLRKKPSVDDKVKRVWIVPYNYEINVTKTNGRWGYTEIKASDGKTYKGWTRLDYYLQLLDEPMTYSVNSEYSVPTRTEANDGWNSEIINYIDPNQTIHITKLFEDRWGYAIDVPYCINEETGETITTDAWVDINDLIPEPNDNSTNTTNNTNNTRHVNLSNNYTEGYNWDIIYRYLRNELDLNPAVSQAIITNMEYESGLNPNAWCIDTNGLTSYGICQWNGGRYENLMNYCKNNNLDYESLFGQLEFLKYELNTGYAWQYNTVYNYENSEEGCRQAAYFWASKFEVCSSRYWTTRADTAAYEYNPNLS